MNKDTYERISSPIKSHPQGEKILKIINKIATTLVYLTYPIVLFKLAIESDGRFWKVLFIPAISFILVSVFRNYKNAPRPYEVLNINPIIKKTTKGNSFPSRHVFSTFIIGITVYYISIPLGITLMLIGFIVAIVRVLGKPNNSLCV